MRIEVYADVLCPWSYIGKRRLERALSGAEGADRMRVVWRSYELSPDEGKVPGRSAAEALLEWRGAEGPARIELIHSLGRADGLPLDLHAARPVSTFDAHRLIHLGAAHGLADQTVERLLHAYLVEGLNVADHGVLARLGAEAGLPPEAVSEVLAGDAHAADVRADERRAARRAVTGVPMLIVGEGPPVTAIQPPEDLRRFLEDALAATGG
ncbi:protein disulfide isomerase FrnE [Actinocorallia aurea]